MVVTYDRPLRHDIGNDLQVIAGFADVVGTQVADDQTAEYVEKIERSARNSADLIDRVGNLVSTLESQREPEARNIASILEPTVRDVAAQYDSLAVEFDPAEFDYRVFAGDLLDSVFTNVLSNAAVHNDGDVTVALYAERPDPDTVVVGVADDGSGVPESLRADLFEMGVKGPDSEGTGFGLGFVRALTESYGGSVDLGESPDGGADFRVTLDRA
jgi:signal transduction histidine kinase